MSLADVARRLIRPESVYFPGQLVHCSGKSILIYLSVDGDLTPMRVLESDTISSVKLRIQKCRGFKVKKQKLVYEGRELARNGTLIKDYSVTGGNILHLILRLSDLLFIVVRTICGKEFEFHIDRHRNVQYLKQHIKNRKCFDDLENQDLFCNGEKLDDQRMFHDVCKSDDVIHLLVQKSAKVRAKSVEKDVELSVVASTASKESVHGNQKKLEAATEIKGVDFILEPIIVNPKIRIFPFLREMMNSTYNGLKKGFKPVRSSEGTGGTYLMQDEKGKEYVAVFKPMDEEPLAVNNPRDLQRSINGEGLKIGTKVEEGALREVAAYILDHQKGGRREVSGEAMMGFAGVPPTIMVKCLHEGFNYRQGFKCSSKHAKIGSLQMFMNNDGNCEDIGPGAFPVEEVHKITVLDIRMANADRHSGNILYRKEPETDKIILIPIDHGYCLPEKYEDCTFDWLYWPQARKPYSPDTVEYIKSMNAEKDIELLKYYGWDVSKECARVLRISTMLLKKGVDRGLTPYAIGSIMCRKDMSRESEIEEMIKEAQDSLLPGMSESAFLEAISQIMDSHLEQKQLTS